MADSFAFTSMCLNTVYSLPSVSDFNYRLKVISDFRKCRQSCAFVGETSVVPREFGEFFELERQYQTKSGDYLVHHIATCPAALYKFVDLQKLVPELRSTFTLISPTGPLETTYVACDEYIAGGSHFDYGHSARIEFISNIRWLLAHYMYTVYYHVDLTEALIPVATDVQNTAMAQNLATVLDKLKSNKMTKLADFIATVFV